MAKIASYGDFRNAVYSINISDEEKALLRTSEKGMRLIQECNMKRGVLTHSALSELSEAVNEELQRLQSLKNVEGRRKNLVDAEARRTKGLELYSSRRGTRR